MGFLIRNRPPTLDSQMEGTCRPLCRKCACSLVDVDYVILANNLESEVGLSASISGESEFPCFCCKFNVQQQYRSWKK